MAIPPPDHAGDDNTNAINTLFVTGLPNDVNAREMLNLFGGRPGFDYCEIRNTRGGNQVAVFVTFVNHQSAIAALHALNGLKFDRQTSSTLHIKLARSNSNRRNKPGPKAAIVIDKRSTTAKEDQQSSDDGDSETDTDESYEPNKDKSSESVKNACVDPNNTQAAETIPLSAFRYVECIFLRSVLEKDGTNFLHWYCNLGIVLRLAKKLYVLESPVSKVPPASAAKTARDAWMKQKNDSSEVACLMLVNMVSELQELFEHFGAYEMVHALKEMFQVQVRRECFDKLKELLMCKMEEGSPVFLHVQKIKTSVEWLKSLDYPISNELAIDVILNSLPKSYDEFVQNFNLNNRERSIADLDMLLDIYDKNKKTKSSQVLGIREGRVMKPQAKAKEICKHDKGVPFKQAVSKERPA